MFLTGLALTLLGFFLLAFSALQGGFKDSKFFVGGVVGFVPFGFANDKEFLYLGLALTALLFLAAFFLLRS